MDKQQKIAVFTSSGKLFDRIREIVPATLAELVQVATSAEAVDLAHGASFALVDGKWEGDLKGLFANLAASAIYTVLVDDEKHIGDEVPESLSQGLVDDLLLVPIRPLELLSKIKHAGHLLRVSEVTSINSALKTLIEKFEEDLRLTRGIQRTLIPEKFPPVHGLSVTHKYLSGLKSGGDYLDFFEFEDKTHVGILMSDSSGYGLSSAFMSVILKLAVKLSKDEARSPSSTVGKIFEEVSVTMKPKENLSIFYGILNRKTFEMKYASLGSIQFVHQVFGAKPLSRAAAHGPLAKGQDFELQDQTVTLNPEDRLVIFSDGFAEAFDGASSIEKVCTDSFGKDAIELINDFNYRIKAGFEADDDMPAQDCSVMVIDVEKRVMRLAK